MKEFIKENSLLSIIPQLQIKTTLPNPADMSDADKIGALVIKPDDGIYLFDETNDVWEKILDIASAQQDTDNIIGTIKPIAVKLSKTDITGWLRCDGSTYNVNDYPKLAAVIDPTLQPGDTFTLPLLQNGSVGYIPTMIGTSSVVGMNSDVYTLGQLKTPQIEEHNHGTTIFNHKHQYSPDHKHLFRTESTINTSARPSTNDSYSYTYVATSTSTMNGNAETVSDNITQSNTVSLSFDFSGRSDIGVLGPNAIRVWFYIKAE